MNWDPNRTPVWDCRFCTQLFYTALGVVLATGMLGIAWVLIGCASCCSR